MYRKVVTALFCDVVGSTALGESIDPELLQGLLARYFERMRAIVERHEGTVEKFAGDAVMAVFGVPVAHEDDALRACRAALEMQAAFPELGVPGRIGVNTGEVVTGTEERLATGDAVNVAARLQQAAEPGEVLIGELTLELVRAAVEADPVPPLVLKGKAEPVRGFRLLAVHEPERRHEARFVGREGEVGLVRAAWERALTGRQCELVTVVGEAGVGKSRLVDEALASLETRVVGGRCLPYGDGITYWPVVEVLKQLDALPSEPAAAAAIRSLLGEVGQATTSEEIAWAFRKLVAEQAPLVVVFDDLQWGEETFLDLVEGAALLASGGALLLVAIARPELLDRRPTWPVAIRLEPLPDPEVEEMIGERVPAELRERIARAAGGNPLFVSEMVAMAAGSTEVEVPPTLRALLAARLDQLDGAERRVLEHGAVEGAVFHRGAVQALTPEEPQVTPRLAALVRRELIRPDRTHLPGEDGFRFRHLLIRDAAYDRLPKSARADLHERFARWLDEHGAGLVELDEILGYHLEQAARYLAELGRPDPLVAGRAGERLAAAGRGALWRSDSRAAASLLARALALTPASRPDVRLELDLAAAYGLGNSRLAAATADAAADRARGSGDEAGEALARAVAAGYRVLRGETTVDEVEARARAALPLLERANDHAGLVDVWSALAFGVANPRAQYEQMAQACEQAIRQARLAGQPQGRLLALELALVYGPRPADEALSTLDALLPDHPPPGPLASRSCLLAMLGRFEEAWPLAHEAIARWRELTGYGAKNILGEIAILAGDHEAAAGYLRSCCDWQEEQGLRSILSTYAPKLGRELCLLGRHEEAEPLARLGRELCEPGDVITEMLWRQAQALVHSRRGEHAEAEELAREAVARGEQTDTLNWQGDALCDLAEVLWSAGKTSEAVAALEQALDRYERKKNLAMVAQLRARLADLTDRAPA